jgi:hypothetical protein
MKLPNYVQVDQTNYKVVAIAASHNIMVERETLDNRLLGCTYDPDTGLFSGYKITLKTNKSYIMADGVDTIRISASIKTWDDQDASATFTDPILFVVDGTPRLVTKKAEGYYVDYKTTMPGTKQIYTQGDSFVLNGSVTVMVVEVEVEPGE